jgi:undecaprenyl-diphosphatase
MAEVVVSKVMASAKPVADGISREHRARHLRAYKVEVALVLGIIAFAILAVTAWMVPYFRFDVPVIRAIQSINSPLLDTFTYAVNWIGFPPQSNFIFGSMIFALFVFKKRWEAAGLLFAAAGSASLWFLLAPMIHRPRPSPDLVNVAAQIGHGSFPSGHVLNLTATLGFLLFLFYTQLRPSWWRTVLLVLFAIPVAGIGFSRLYAGQHWPSDVLGGYLLGTIWLGITVVLYRGVTQHWRHGRAFGRTPTDAEQHDATGPHEGARAHETGEPGAERPSRQAVHT